MSAILKDAGAASAIARVTRRDFLKITPAASAGLVLALYLPANSTAAGNAFQPSVWLEITPDDKVKIWMAKCELGQGVFTALPQIVADELEADWEKVEVIQAPLDRRYGEQGTGGSTSLRTSWDHLRKAGATARAMLLAAAAQQWKVEPSACHAENGSVLHASTGRRVSYGKLVAAAAKLPVPENPPLKEQNNFRIIGASVPRRDGPAKVAGTATFGLDFRVPGMLYAALVRSSAFGGKATIADASRAKAIPGVRDVIQLPGSVAVVAENTWAALKGRDAVQASLDPGPHATESSDTLRSQFEELTSKPAKAFRNDGDAEAALKGAAKRVDSVYELPFLAHAPMEPMNCVVHVKKDGAEVWAPTQSPAFVRDWVQRATGLAPDSIRVNVLFSGGAFGRRWFPDEAAEAAAVSKAVGVPIQVVYSREDDMQHGYYRPASYHRLSGGLDADGWPVAWLHRYSSTSILGYLEPNTKTPEAIELDGATDFPYRVPNVRVEYAPASSGVPRGWLRSVSHTFTAFVVQSFLDELAAAAGKDPLAYRLHLLGEPRKITYPDPADRPLDTGRLRTVLELAAEKSGWGKPLPAGRARGLAHHYSFQSYVATVAEVSLADDGKLRVERVVCAADCGTVVNPNIAAAQMEGGAIYGLNAVLYDKITIREGRVEQGNFDSYPIVRMNEAPPVEVYFVPSTESPTGLGEPGVPPIAPAVCNALFALTGRRVRRLPMR